MSTDNTWLIVGACSGMAVHLCRELASRGNRLYLLDLDGERLAAQADDLRARYKVDVETRRFDVTGLHRHEELINRIESTFGKIYGIVWIAGIMGDEDVSRTDYRAAKQVLDVNFTAAMTMLHIVAERLEKRGRGHIVGFSSPAGDRGRASNYIYGAAKGALATLLSGLRQRLSSKGVKVLTIKPGFVDTKMTRDMNLPFAAEPADVARDIAKAIDSGKSVAYVPWFWQIIMTIVKLLPEAIFKRVSF
jgi:decaprenylphospho-beta-D-erythro-pentofuranosid-2-ulose 2-reductase